MRRTAQWRFKCWTRPRTDEGSLIPGVRDTDGDIHGELVLGPKEMQFATFNDMKAIFDRAGTRSRIIVTPITRFVISRAATARTTCRTSRRSTSSTSRWRQCRRNRNDFSFGLGLRHIRVLSPWSCLQQRGDSMWAPDGVHRKEEGYKTTAEQVVMVKVVNKRERENDETPQPFPMRPRARGGGRGGGRGRRPSASNC